ncbi:MAG: sensor domain-containing diguanylate cyclase [Nitrospiraceae bacterium]|nr:MAG: sensor domain-containing diguanylate cyclase [Nitrospiraceae bacterium]
MKLRSILIIMALIALLSALAGGAFYYFSLLESELEYAHKDADGITARQAGRIDSRLAEHQKSAMALAGLPELEQALLQRSPLFMTKANVLLDHFRNSFEASVCYLMDSHGITVASSNRNEPASFVGKDYAFRPYFQEAMNGNSSIYMALGVTSGERGVYFGHPIYGSSSTVPSGVAVIKAPIDSIEKEFMREFEGTMSLADPHGVIFVSSRRDWLFHVLWKPSDDELSSIKETMQFGNGPWTWTGIEKKDSHSAVDTSGNEYRIHLKELKNYPGWNVVYLHDHKAVSAHINKPLFKSTGYVLISLAVIISISVGFLYKKASSDIVMRQRAEQALRESEEHLKAMTITDELTGLSNRRGFFMLAEQQMKIAERTKKGAFLVYADLDNLKEINDSQGHKAGDQAIIDAAQILRNTYRKSDIIARMGGDEFAAFLVDFTGSSPDIISAHLQRNINMYNTGNKRGSALSFSSGIVAWDSQKPCSLDELIARADKAMYEQKTRKKGIV